MNQLMACSGCGGFLGPSDAVCPHCDARPARSRYRRLGVLFGLAGSASLGLTMMACYGCPAGSGGCYDLDLPDAGGDTTGDTTGDTGNADGGAPD